MRSRRRALVIGIACLLFAPIAAAALVPVRYDSREELFDVPKGTWARRMAGEKLELLPSEIRLVVGLRDTLVFRNSDDVPHMFGPTLLMPGQSLRIPFSTPSENQFACTAHANGQLLIIVEDAPATPWARLRWRAGAVLR